MCRVVSCCGVGWCGVPCRVVRCSAVTNYGNCHIAGLKSIGLKDATIADAKKLAVIYQ